MEREREREREKGEGASKTKDEEFACVRGIEFTKELRVERRGGKIYPRHGKHKMPGTGTGTELEAACPATWFACFRTEHSGSVGRKKTRQEKQARVRPTS